MPPPQVSHDEREEEGRSTDVDQNQDMVWIDLLAKVMRLLAERSGANTVPKHRLQRIPGSAGKAATPKQWRHGIELRVQP